ncbi:hypothetical protein Q4488_08150 [Amphritea sp. 1_MG-2023]|uniref:hypothetical protein n=1 Tax=Amphritea sp. 1_MG-2023 TaxID=3062670 RepID=UPI0026E35228|nr:hypothetical protein [Amphritea sp. 1_MG-2023]MDO6563354.1 hypothetical protein [Amphritea sp. 1_MG-2023]
MPYQYAITECEDYLRIEVKGTRTKADVIQDSLSMWQDVAKHCRTKGFNLILAIFHLQGTRSISDTFNIVAGVQEWIWPELTIAYVDTNPANLKNNILTEKSAMIHGINFRTFLSEEDGVAWLQAMHSTSRY